MGGTKIFDIKTDKFFLRENRTANFEKEAKAITGIASKRIANFLAEKTKLVLGKDMVVSGAQGPIGSSGRSADAIQVVRGNEETNWMVVEGPGGSNEVIRKGVKPEKQIPVDRIQKWVAEKGISLIYNQKTRDSLRLKSVKGYQTSRGKTVDSYIRARPKKGFGPQSRDKAAVVYYKIKSALQAYGTERETSNWWELYPKDKGRFDYVYYVSNTYGRQIENILDSYFDSDLGARFTASVERVMSGRKTGVSQIDYGG